LIAARQAEEGAGPGSAELEKLQAEAAGPLPLIASRRR
jgi:hypothetical protein